MPLGIVVMEVCREQCICVLIESDHLEISLSVPWIICLGRGKKTYALRNAWEGLSGSGKYMRRQVQTVDEASSLQ